MSDLDLTCTSRFPFHATMLEAALWFWWPQLEGLSQNELELRARQACWRFHGGESSFAGEGHGSDEEREENEVEETEVTECVIGDGLAAGDSHGAARAFDALAEMVACITLHEAAWRSPRPVCLFGEEFRYRGDSPPVLDEPTSHRLIGHEWYCADLLKKWSKLKP